MLAFSSVVITSCSSDMENATYDVMVDDISYYEKFRDRNIKINVYNWGEYISNGSDGSLDIIKAFEDISGIKVNYTTFATNEDLYAKFKSSNKTGYDVIIPSDYMIDKMIDEGMLAELNYDNIPNYKYIDDQFKKTEYDNSGVDGTARYSVPYTWGTVGIIYNKKWVTEEEASTWDVLWNPKFKNYILMFSNSKDAFAISLKRSGYNMNTTDPEEIEKAAEELRKQKPLVQTYVMDQIFDKMRLEEAWVAPYYAGDAITMIEDAAENGVELGFQVPKIGTNLFVDAMCIPKDSDNKEAAEAFINFLCEIDIMVANGEYIYYSIPSTVGKNATIQRLEEYVAEGDMTQEDVETYIAVSYPDEDILKNCDSFINLPKETNELIIRKWTDLLTGIDEDTWWNKAILPVSIILALGFCILIILLRYRKAQKKRAKY